VVVTSDVHACLGEDKKRGRIGLARLSAYLKKVRQEFKSVFLLDAGDGFSGHALSGLDGGRTVASLLGGLGYRLMTPGNHDFDFNLEENDPFYYFTTLIPLMRASSSSKVEISAINLTLNGGPFPGVTTKPIILERSSGGAAIVSLGVTNPYSWRPSLKGSLPGYEFGFTRAEDPQQVKERLLKSLTEILAPYNNHQNKIIVLSHLGYPSQGDDKISGLDLCSVAGVNVVCDGHSHSLIDPLNINSALYLNLGQQLEGIGEIVLDKGAPPRARLLKYDDFISFAEDQDLNRKIARFEAELGLEQSLITLPLGLSFPKRTSFFESEPLGRLVCLALGTFSQADMVLLNPGAIRAGLEGEITKEKAFEVLPFGDRLMSSLVSGERLRQFWTLFLKKGLEGLPYRYGFIIAAKPAESEGAELVELKDSLGRRIKSSNLYRLAFSGQMARIFSLKTAGNDLIDHGPLIDCFAEGLKKLSPDSLFRLANFNDIELTKA
jgi:5'-nucleotidase